MNKKWLDDYQNIILIGILTFAVLVRFYYFLITTSQPLWWDEAVYGSLAKNLAFGNIWGGTYLIQHETFIRPMLFPFLWAGLLRLGLQETGVRFLFEFLPSVIAVFFVYLTTKELYNKRIALISTLIFSTLWIHLFYSTRLLTDVPSLALLFSSFYFFMKSQKTNFNPKHFGISIFLLSIATLIRYPNGLFFISYLLFLILTWRKDLLKNKGFWIAGIIGLVPLFIFFTLNYSAYGNIFPELLSGQYYDADRGDLPIAFGVLKIIPLYLKTPFFILFIAGIILACFDLLIGYDLVGKRQILKSHLFLLLIFIVFFSYFIFVIRGAEDRYLLPVAITLVSIGGLGGDWIYRIFRDNIEKVSIFVIGAILILGCYQELTFAGGLINEKKDDFLYERKGFEWINQNTPKDSITCCRGTGPYSLYYAERKYLEQNISEIRNTKADYYVYNAYRPDTIEIIDYIQKDKDKWKPINAFFFDDARTQPAFIVFQNWGKNE